MLIHLEEVVLENVIIKHVNIKGTLGSVTSEASRYACCEFLVRSLQRGVRGQTLISCSDTESTEKQLLAVVTGCNSYE